jgi:ADP-ribosylation factor protein 1
MGNFFERIRGAFDAFGKQESRIVLIGLDGAGKTTILYKLKLDEVVSSVPTIGFNVEKVQYKNLEFNIWDIGGQTKIRNLWKFYYDNTDAIIYVVDTSDAERMAFAKETLSEVLSDDRLANAPLLVFANKVDISNMTTPEVVSSMGLQNLRREWYVQPTCALSGSGLCEGFEWLSKEVKNKRKRSA